MKIIRIIFLGNLKFKERGLIDIPLWFIYLFIATFVPILAVKILFVILSVPALIRLLLTISFAVWSFAIGFLPNKIYMKLVFSDFNTKFRKLLDNLYNDKS